MANTGVDRAQLELIRQILIAQRKLATTRQRYHLTLAINSLERVMTEDPAAHEPLVPKDLLAAMHADHGADAWIAEALFISRSYVITLRRNLGLPPAMPPGGDQNQRRVARQAWEARWLPRLRDRKTAP